MRLDKTIKPEVFASQDATRPHLTHVHFNATLGELAATDGHRMIVAPVGNTELDDSGPVTIDAIKAARKLAGRARDTTPEIHANGSLSLADGSAFARPPEHADTKFPPYQRVMAVSGTPRASVGVSAKYLASVFAAVGDKYVTMHIRGDLDPIVFEAPSDFGTVTILIMPSRK